MQVHASQRLKLAASAAIMVGNSVNVGTPYGDAKAVRLESLLKLADLRVIAWPVVCDLDTLVQFIFHA